MGGRIEIYHTSQFSKTEIVTEMVDLNFIHKNLPNSDRDLFFGPLGSDNFQTFECETLGPLMVVAGKFPSLTQARKNGWDRPLATGFQQFVVGGKSKNRTVISVLNRF